MDYFIGKGIGGHLTGIEKAQMNRLQLFKKMGRPAQILRFSYTNSAYDDAARFGVAEADLCNMFDWYQHTQHVVRKSITPAMVCPEGAQMQVAGREGEIIAANCVRDGQVIAQIRFAESTNGVTFVLWPDATGHVQRTDTYDTRGFLSLRSRWSATGKRTVDEYLDASGAVAVRYRFAEDISQSLKDITLADGRVLTTVDELRVDFLQALDRQSPSRFFFDRDYANEMMTTVALRGPKFMMVHNNHRNYTQIMQVNEAKVLDELGVKVKGAAPKRGNLITEPLEAPGDLSGIITATPRQQAALQEDYPALPPVYVAPAGVSVTQPQRVDFNTRDPQEMIVVARISPEKGVGESVQVALQLHERFPNAHLSVYGAATGTVAVNYLQYMNKRILKTKAAGAVTFMGFRDHLDSIYNHAGMMLVNSSTEAFPTSIQEALAHGLPVISYDIEYGPADMITDGENGRLVPAGDRDAMVEVIDMLLRHPDQLEMLSNGAYRLRKKYGARAVWKQYQQLPETK